MSLLFACQSHHMRIISLNSVADKIVEMTGHGYGLFPACDLLQTHVVINRMLDSSNVCHTDIIVVDKYDHYVSIH